MTATTTYASLPPEHRQLVIPSITAMLGDLVPLLPEGERDNPQQAAFLLQQVGQALQVIGLHGLQRMTAAMHEAVLRADASLLPTPSAGLATTQAHTPARPAAPLLMQAADALQLQLQALEAGQWPDPQALFPTYRALIKLGGRDNAHPADLWDLPGGTASPSAAALDQALHSALQATAAAPALEPGEPVRAQFDQYVLSLIRTSDTTAAAGLRTLCLGLAQTAPVAAQRGVWLLAAGWLDAMTHGLLPADLYTKRMASRLLMQYAVQAKGEDRVLDTLQRDLLYHCDQVARTHSILPAVLASICTHCGLHTAAAPVPHTVLTSAETVEPDTPANTPANTPASTSVADTVSDIPPAPGPVAAPIAGADLPHATQATATAAATSGGHPSASPFGEHSGDSGDSGHGWDSSTAESAPAPAPVPAPATMATTTTTATAVDPSTRAVEPAPAPASDPAPAAIDMLADTTTTTTADPVATTATPAADTAADTTPAIPAPTAHPEAAPVAESVDDAAANSGGEPDSDSFAFTDTGLGVDLGPTSDAEAHLHPATDPAAPTPTLHDLPQDPWQAPPHGMADMLAGIGDDIPANTSDRTQEEAPETDGDPGDATRGETAWQDSRNTTQDEVQQDMLADIPGGPQQEGELSMPSDPGMQTAFAHNVAVPSPGMDSPLMHPPSPAADQAGADQPAAQVPAFATATEALPAAISATSSDAAASATPAAEQDATAALPLPPEDSFPPAPIPELDSAAAPAAATSAAAHPVPHAQPEPEPEPETTPSLLHVPGADADTAVDTGTACDTIAPQTVLDEAAHTWAQSAAEQAAAAAAEAPASPATATATTAITDLHAAHAATTDAGATAGAGAVMAAAAGAALLQGGSPLWSEDRIDALISQLLPPVTGGTGLPAADDSGFRPLMQGGAAQPHIAAPDAAFLEEADAQSLQLEAVLTAWVQAAADAASPGTVVGAAAAAAAAASTGMGTVAAARPRVAETAAIVQAATQAATGATIAAVFGEDAAAVTNPDTPASAPAPAAAASDQPAGDPDTANPAARAAQLADSLTRSAWTAGCADISTLAHTLQRTLERLTPSAVDAPLPQRQTCLHAAEEIRRLLHQFAAGFFRRPHPQIVQPLHDLLAQLPELSPAARSAARTMAHAATSADAAADQATTSTPLLGHPGVANGAAACHADADNPATATLAITPGDVHDEAPIPSLAALAPDPVAAALARVAPPAAINPAHFAIFEEEFRATWPLLQAAYWGWMAAPADATERQTLLRHLHTLKGSARLTGALPWAAQVHALEDLALSVRDDPAALEQPMQALRVGFTALQQEMANRHPGVDATATRRPLDTVALHAQTLWSTHTTARTALDVCSATLVEMDASLSRLRDQLTDCAAWADALLLHSSELADDFQQELGDILRALNAATDDIATIHRQAQHGTAQAGSTLHVQGEHLRALQHTLVHARLMPLSQLEHRLQGTVRLACADTGKPVRLLFEGSDTLMDRDTAEALIPALEHLLRNCVDHGIEPARQRAEAGKKPLGHITVALHTHGTRQALVVRDDGAGLNLHRIRARALSLGLLPPQADNTPITPEQAAQLILHPGLSTALKLTEMSGRGIGMDAVQARVRDAGGQLFIHSKTGQGCSFAIILPTPPQVEQVLCVRAGNWRVAVPARGVEGMHRIPVSVAAPALERGLLPDDTRGPMPLYWAGAVWQQSARSQERAEDGTVPVLTLRSDTGRWGLVVDEVLDTQEVVLHPPADMTTAPPGLLGTAAQPTGEVLQVYEPTRVITAHETRLQNAPPAPAAAATAGDVPACAATFGTDADGTVTAAADAVVTPAEEAPPPPPAPLVLLVDDSLSVRRIAQHLLQSHGWRVITAADGEQALQQLLAHEAAPPALMLVDIEMPGINGLELLERVRHDARWRQIPVVMLTAHEPGPVSQKALDIGAQAYLTKPYSPPQLLAQVRRYCPLPATTAR